MTRLVVVVVLLVAAGVRGQADDRPAPVLPVVSTQPSDGREQATEPAAEEKEALWLKLKRGTRVRLMVEDARPMREVVGRLLESDRTTVTVDTAGGPQRFSRDTLFHLQYRTGGRDREKGAAIGASITGLAGLVAGVVLLEKERGNSDEVCTGCSLVVGLFGIAGAIPGGAIGFAIGAPGSDWRNASPDGLTVTGGASPRRATVALRLRFGR